MSNITALGYLVARGPAQAWRDFATEVLGLQIAPETDNGAVRFRMDDRAWRIEIQDGPPGPDALVALGYECPSEAHLMRAVDHLRSIDVPVEEDSALAAFRKVRRLFRLEDPEGCAIELFVGAQSSKAPFVSPRGVRFVTGDLGLGHAFLLSGDGPARSAWFQKALGFALSDTIGFGAIDGYFLHCNPRHHSLAVATSPGPPPGIGHLMLEVDTLEAVGRALDIVKDRKDRIAVSLGEHTNDRMISFYVATPSGFPVEYGFNGKIIDEDSWKVAHYDSASLWGHVFSPGEDAPTDARPQQH